MAVLVTRLSADPTGARGVAGGVEEHTVRLLKLRWSVTAAVKRYSPLTKNRDAHTSSRRELLPAE